MAGGSVTIDMPTDALTTRDGAAPGPFELCDARGACAWADATLDNGRLVVTSDAARAPTEVRYCWGDAPVCALTTADGPPFGPFRLSVD